MAIERDEAKRTAWREEVEALAKIVPDLPSRLKFIDESACHLSLTRLYGWARRNERCLFAVPGNNGPRRSMVALFSLDGALGAHRVQEGSLKGVHFADFIECDVLPHLEAGDVVILDNARCHQGKVVRELIESVGARLLFLPPYSPDFSPIELAWRKVKANLRQVGARTKEVLLEAIETAMQTVTTEDARAFYTHCGYLDRKLAEGSLQP